ANLGLEFADDASIVARSFLADEHVLDGVPARLAIQRAAHAAGLIDQEQNVGNFLIELDGHVDAAIAVAVAVSILASQAREVEARAAAVRAARLVVRAAVARAALGMALPLLAVHARRAVVSFGARLATFITEQ